MRSSHAICFILNLFCKVRGEKVIKGFLNNEPRYLELILKELEAGRNLQMEDSTTIDQQSAFPWVERYVLLLWLSHLMLAPFPLDSMSELQPSVEVSNHLGVILPPEAPGFTLRILTVCIESLRSASKERGAAAHLLVRLCVRHDMQKLGLLDTMVKWALSFIDRASKDHADIHQCLGILSFLSGLVASATNDEVGAFLSAIYSACQKILDQDSLAFVKSSAVARKLVIKCLRNVVLHCLQAPSAHTGLDSTVVIEEVIAFLLEALADADTPVRYGASKALSIITMRLDPDMAEEVAEAILGSLTESVYWQGSKRNLNSVNSLRWHGLTLTLSQLLYRKAISVRNLPVVLNALLLSLGFEQRSPTGGSIGTNVRDAACFGIWALSRRYSTVDLLAVDTGSIRAAEHRKALSVPQVLAIELVVTACLDPAGNIRRGSSAALQELIGRHPNTIEEGITLVQMVDFNAVGLRQKAICNVAIKAGNLRPIYWEAIFEDLLEWRGTGSLDSDSRLFAARAVGQLSQSQNPSTVQWMSDQVCKKLRALRSREVEERQGLVSALAALADTASSVLDTGKLEANKLALLHLWQFFGKELKLEEKSITSPTLRPEFTASSMCNFLGALAALTNRLPKENWPSEIPTEEVVRVLNLCLTRYEESVLAAIIRATPATIELLSQASGINAQIVVSEWLSKLENEASYNGLRCSGHAVALGATFGIVDVLEASAATIELRKQIAKVLTFRCTSAVAIKARTVALLALGVLLRDSLKDAALDPIRLASDVEAQIGSALHVALNDYTITEQGDVGALVRLEALNSVSFAWGSDVLQDNNSEISQQIFADVLRLSLEKLDKIRAKAAQILKQRMLNGSPSPVTNLADDVSSHAYFTNILGILQSTPTPSPTIKESVCVGLVSSSGMASESVVQNSRAALLDFIDALPDEEAPSSQQFTLIEFANCIMHLLKQNITNDRVLLPLLEVVAFLFDMQVMQRLISTPFKYVTFPSLPTHVSMQSRH